MLQRLIRQIFGKRGKAPETSPRLDALLAAGRRAHLEGRHADAERSYRAVLALDAEHAEATFLLAVTCHATGRLDEAFRLGHRAWERNPHNADWRSGVMHISNDIGKAEGVPACEAWVRESGDFVVWMGLGNALREAGRLEEANGAYRQAQALKPDSPFVARRYAALLAITGDNEAADRLFRQSAHAGLWPDGVMHLSREFFEGLERDRASLSAAISPLQGAFGDAAGKTVIFISGDPAYLRRFLYALVNSVRLNGGIDCLFHVHVVKPDATIVQDVEQVKADLQVSLACTWEHPDITDGEQLRVYYACARFAQLPRLMEAYRVPILVLDLDQLVLGGLGALHSRMAAYDIGIIQWHPSRWDPWDMFWASAVWFQPTPAAREFADWNARYLGACLRSGGLQWMLDQASLFCVRAHLASIGRAPHFEMLPTGLAFLAGSLADSASAATPPAGTVFWSIIFSLTVNHSALDHPLFKRYLRPASPGTGTDGAGRQA